MGLFLYFIFYSVPLAYGSVLWLIPHCLDYCSIIVCLKIGQFESFSYVFFFRIVLAILVPLLFHLNFSVSLSISTKYLIKIKHFN